MAEATLRADFSGIGRLSMCMITFIEPLLMQYTVWNQERKTGNKSNLKSVIDDYLNGVVYREISQKLPRPPYSSRPPRAENGRLS